MCMQEKGQREIEEGKGGGEFRIREKQREEGAKGTLRETGPLAYMGIVEQKPPHTLPAPPANKEPVAHSWDPLSVPEGEGILPPLRIVLIGRLGDALPLPRPFPPRREAVVRVDRIIAL